MGPNMAAGFLVLALALSQSRSTGGGLVAQFVPQDQTSFGIDCATLIRVTLPNTQAGHQALAKLVTMYFPGTPS